MIVLGIDTATRTASVGLLSDDETLAESSRAGERRLAATGLPLVEEVLQAAGCDAGEIDLIAVSAGPGSFTGLRIGMSLAKGIAFATGCEVVAVPTLEALALAAGPRSGLVCPVLDARKGEVYAALFDGAEEPARRLVADCAVTPDGVATWVDRPCTMIGDGIEPYFDEWKRLLAGRGEFLSFKEFHPRGALVARLGRRYRVANGADGLAAMVPRYCRPPQAERNRLENRGHKRSDAKIDRLGGLG